MVSLDTLKEAMRRLLSKRLEMTPLARVTVDDLLSGKTVTFDLYEGDSFGMGPITFDFRFETDVGHVEGTDFPCGHNVEGRIEHVCPKCPGTPMTPDPIEEEDHE